MDQFLYIGDLIGRVITANILLLFVFMGLVSILGGLLQRSRNPQSKLGKSLIDLGSLGVLLSSAGQFYLHLQMQEVNREFREASKFVQYSSENYYKQELYRLLKEVDEKDISQPSSDYDEIYRSTDSCTGLMADPGLTVDKIARKGDQYVWLHKIKTFQNSDQSEKTLSAVEGAAFTNLLKENSFWAMPSLPQDYGDCYDCCIYYFEGYKGGQYHYIRRIQIDGVLKGFNDWLHTIKERK